MYCTESRQPWIYMTLCYSQQQHRGNLLLSWDRVVGAVGGSRGRMCCVCHCMSQLDGTAPALYCRMSCLTGVLTASEAGAECVCYPCFLDDRLAVLACMHVCRLQRARVRAVPAQHSWAALPGPLVSKLLDSQAQTPLVLKLVPAPTAGTTTNTVQHFGQRTAALGGWAQSAALCGHITPWWYTPACVRA